MKRILLTLIVLSQVLLITAQENEAEKNFGISFSGFVKNDFFYDSRQTVTAREGHFLLWPSAEAIDENGVDVNASPTLNMLAIQSRLTGKITGPDAFGAKTSGVIEGDFFATGNDYINLFRMRHAFLKLSWPNTELLAGQYWNPLFVTGCFPGTVSFNTGVPIQSFARNPQIRVTQSFGKLKIIGAVLTQRDYASRGATGPSSSYLRNSVIPDLHLQAQFATSNEETGFSYLAGAGIAWKTITPRLSSTVTISPEITNIVVADTIATMVVTPAVTETYAVDESVSGLSFIVYQNLKLKPLTIKLQYRYGENIADLLGISGFAVQSITDAATGERSYTPFTSHTVWADIHTNGKKFQAGVFAGVTLNKGTKDAVDNVNISANAWGLGQNIASLLRVSPRLIWNSGKVRLALEAEFTQAVYGSDFDTNYVAATLTPVLNLRGLFSMYYFF